MGKTKFSESADSAAQSVVDTAKTQSNAVNKAATGYKNSANAISIKWSNLYNVGISRYAVDWDEDGKAIDWKWQNTYPGIRGFSSESAAADNQKNYIVGKKGLYDGYANKTVSETASIINDDVLDKLEKINTCLLDLKTAVDTFEGESPSLSEAIEALEKANLADNITIEGYVDANGNEVQRMYYNDADGNKYTIAEMVNCFYTYIGASMSGSIATSMMFGEGGSQKLPDGVTLDQYINNYISGIGNNVYQLMGKGYMSVASLGNINAMYADAMGIDLKDVDIKGEYESLLGKQKIKEQKASELFGSLLGEDTNAILAGGASVAALAANAMGDEKMYSADNVTEAEKRRKAEEEIADKDKPAEDEDKEETTGAEETGTENKNPDWSDYDGGSNGGNPYGGYDGGSPGGGGENPPAEPVPPANGGNTPETDNRFTDLVEAEIPSEPPALEITNEEVDSLARDEFYERYSIPSDLAERRQMDIDKFDELFSSENKDALVQKFIEMGYDPAEALGAANNKDVGLAAFLLGSQNQELTQIASDFATDLGLGDKFDTSYDNAPDYTDLFDGDAQVELTSPSTSEAIMSAKADVQEAKTAYSESVASANQYIEQATKAKGDLESLRSSIESVSGKDTSKWTEDQISQYNKAAETYNTAVTKANEEVAAAGKAKELYTQAKDNLQKVEESYYNEIREAAKQQNGFNSGTNDSPIGAIGSPNTGNMTGPTDLGNNPTQEPQQVTDEQLIDQLFVNM